MRIVRDRVAVLQQTAYNMRIICEIKFPVNISPFLRKNPFELPQKAISNYALSRAIWNHELPKTWGGYVQRFNEIANVVTILRGNIRPTGEQSNPRDLMEAALRREINTLLTINLSSFYLTNIGKYGVSISPESAGDNAFGPAYCIDDDPKTYTAAQVLIERTKKMDLAFPCGLIDLLEKRCMKEHPAFASTEIRYGEGGNFQRDAVLFLDLLGIMSLDEKESSAFEKTDFTFPSIDVMFRSREDYNSFLNQLHGYLTKRIK